MFWPMGRELRQCAHLLRLVLRVRGHAILLPRVWNGNFKADAELFILDHEMEAGAEDVGGTNRKSWTRDQGAIRNALHCIDV